MTSHKKAVILLVLLLLLSACGGGEAERLQEENAALQRQAAAMEEEKDALQEQAAEIEKEKDELQKQIDSLQTELEQTRGNPDWISRENNPISHFYRSVEDNGTTAGMSAVNASCAAAWETEARNLAEQLKAQLYFQEDRDLVDAYIATAEKQVEYMDQMAMYPVSDLRVPQANRLSTAGTLVHVFWPGARAGIWSDIFFQIYGIMPESVAVVHYTFIFDAEAARLELEEWLR